MTATKPPKAFVEWYAPKASLAAEVLPRGFAREMESLSLQAWRASRLAALAEAAKVAEESQNTDNWNTVKNVADRIRALKEEKNG